MKEALHELREPFDDAARAERALDEPDDAVVRPCEAVEQPPAFLGVAFPFLGLLLLLELLWTHKGLCLREYPSIDP